MTGWCAAGFVAGNEFVVKAYGDIKGQLGLGSSWLFNTRRPTRWTIRKSRKIADKYFAPNGTRLVEVLRKRASARRSRKDLSFSTSKRQRRSEAGRQALELRARGSFASADHRAAISTVPWDEAGPYLRFRP